MHIKWHVLGTATLGAGLVLVERNFSTVDWLAVLAGGVLIDLVDHGVWGLVNIRPLTVASVKKVGWKKFRKMEPGFYFFHTVEVFLICWWLTKSFSWGKYFMTAYGLHLLMDGIKYRLVWKNWKWLKDWSVVMEVREKFERL